MHICIFGVGGKRKREGERGRGIEMHICIFILGRDPKLRLPFRGPCNQDA